LFSLKEAHTAQNGKAHEQRSPLRHQETDDLADAGWTHLSGSRYCRVRFRMSIIRLSTATGGPDEG
jgi:hypothetical protein